jgi:hypothetical protein
MAVAKGTTATHLHFRDRLLLIGLATLGIDLLCGVIAFLVEHAAPQSQTTNFGDALFWTSTQLLTVSSNIRNPITPAGKVLDVFMEVYAVTIIAALAGSVGTFLHRRSSEREREESPA